MTRPAAALLLVVALLAAVAGHARDAPARSGFADMSAATQAMQRDDTQNPGMLWVAEGAERWRDAQPGGACADCHHDATRSMRGVAARYPVFDGSSGRALTLAARLRQCRETRQRAPRAANDGDVLLALQTFVAHQSRGLPITPAHDPRLQAELQRGERLWQQPFGQLALSCAMCHDQLAGQRLAGSLIPQGHPNGYPLYRLEWQALGSLQRRMRNCLVGVRAEPFAPGATEWTALELYLMRRAAGLPLETPAVRP
jgi:L-cysteine S-thiosulfotransferase